MIYLDNAATTPLDPEVCDFMSEVMKNCYGNPSSVHAYGRQARVLIEESREKIASCLKAAPSEIYFTSGGTEAINTVIHHCLVNEKFASVVSSPVEHHAVLHALKHFGEKDNIKVKYLDIDHDGRIDLNDLENELVNAPKPCLVCLMHANNETGVLLPLKDTASICAKFGCTFLCDTVQTIGKFNINLTDSGIHYAPCSAHKFHGPKGVGLLYVKKGKTITPIFFGGSQERGIRPSTENIYGIAGMARAFEVAHRNMENDITYIRKLKQYFVDSLNNTGIDIMYNGNSDKDGLHTILNVSFLGSEKSEMLLYQLDIAGIAVSSGSACTSGSVMESHVLKAMRTDPGRVSLRFSFSKMNTLNEIEQVVHTLESILNER